VRKTDFGGFATMTEELEMRFKTVFELARNNQALANFKMVVSNDKIKNAPTYRVGDKVWLFVMLCTNKKKEVHKKL